MLVTRFRSSGTGIRSAIPSGTRRERRRSWRRDAGRRAGCTGGSWRRRCRTRGDVRADGALQSVDGSRAGSVGINGRASVYLAALSSNLIALTFIGQMSRLCVWLPARWQRLELGAPSRQKLVTALLRRIRWFDRFSRPRASRLFEHRVTRSVFGALVFGLALSAFLAPPFSGLHTLPSLGVVVIGLGVLLRDLLLAVLDALLGAIGVSTILAIGNLTVETAKHVL